MSWWAGWFPRGFMRSWWGGWFPEDATVWSIPGNGPGGSGTFALVLDVQLTVTYKWRTDVQKSLSGLERRANLDDDPQMTFKGIAHLVGDSVRKNRAILARYTAVGDPFLVGFPQEEATLVEMADLTRVFVTSTAKLDWANKGQRVIVFDPERNSTAEGVIQDVGSNWIDLDSNVSTIAKKYGAIMPALAVYLEPTQGFERYPNPDSVERWDLSGIGITFGWTVAAIEAYLALSGVALSGVLSATTIRARETGPAGNSITFEMSADASTGDGELVEVGDIVHYKFQDGVTTVGQMAETLYVSSAKVQLTGTWNPADLLLASDEFGPLSLANGADESIGDVGLTATLTTFQGRNVWDRYITMGDSSSDSIQSLHQIINLGGVPSTSFNATTPDWARTIAITRTSLLDAQWVKKFLWSVKGRWKAFWLPSWRDDLEWISHATGTILIDVANGIAELDAWYPRINKIQILQMDGVVTYLVITDRLDNNDGTVTLTVVDDAGSPASLSATDVRMISWLELVRFEKDEQALVFKGPGFEFSEQGRVVQR